MGRRKQIWPKRSGRVLGKQSSEAELNRDNGKKSRKGVTVNVDEPFFVSVDRSSWNLEEHYDVSEIVLLNLRVSEDFFSYTLTDEFFRDSRYFLRFRLTNVSQHLGRMKLGHWPVLSESNIILQFVMKHMVEGLETEVVMVSGNVDGPDEGVTGLVHLASLNYITIRPTSGIKFIEGMSSMSVRVEILKSVFDECESLVDNTRQLWKKSMMNVMGWLRPEVLTSEARYGYSDVRNSDEPISVYGDSSVLRKRTTFEVSSFYEAIKSSKREPMLEDDFESLLPELRPYQRRAAYWMVQREKNYFDSLGENEISQSVYPLCLPLNLIDTSARIYYNPFSGNISLHPNFRSSYIPGGILADEMGLGKTVELLCCILAHRMLSDEVASSYKAIEAEASQTKNLKRLKRERVECICGAVNDSYRYEGLWVQCDLCDAWQHGDCVGYSAKRTKVDREGKFTDLSDGNSTKNRQRNDIDVKEMDEEFICQTCSALIQATESPIATGATLIVCPTPILHQWHTEILRHITPGSLRVCVYEGVRYTSFSGEPIVDINELLRADIVLTTYDVLKEDLPHDSERHEGDLRFMRYQKRYPVVPTLLTRILWWRICLDEAQMVEGNAAAAVELALRLHGKHRWCVTGTPIQRKLDDLYGLLRFLQASPFDVLRWWADVISNPYESGDAGAIEFTHKFFKQIMWRSSKAHVTDELQLPPQEECVSWLSFSPIEEHFYQRQHETCVDDAREVIESFKDDIRKNIAVSKLNDASSEPYITNTEAGKLFNSLLKLRQACCHPQVGSFGLRSVQKTPMTMGEILSVLIGKTKVEGEDALRKSVSALNGLAGIAMIKKSFPEAVSLYKEALSLVEEHSEDFRLDPLLNIHLHHNLADVLPLVTENSFHFPDWLFENGERDDDYQQNMFTYIQHLRSVSEDQKHKFLSVFISKLSVAREDFRKSYKQVCDAYSKRTNQDTTWWLEALDHVENTDSSRDLIEKIGEALSGNLNKKSRTPASFRSITALKFYIQTGLDALEESRKTLLDRLLEVDSTMENPREEDIIRIRHCRKCYSEYDGPECTHCELDEIFQVYEARLFRISKMNDGDAIMSGEEAVNLQKKKSALNQFYSNLSKTDKNSTLPAADHEDNGKKRNIGEKVTVSKSPSDLEVMLTIIRNSSRGFLGRDTLSTARQQLDLLEGMRKEYPLARFLSIAQAMVLRAHDEIIMATSRLRIRENEDDKSIDALDQDSLDIASVENSSEKFLALASLSRIKGRLRYLKGLEQSEQMVKSENLVELTAVSENGFKAKANLEMCPVCHDLLGNQKMVFQCGHLTCCRCFIALTEKALSPLEKMRNNERVACPTCRLTTDFGNIAFAANKLYPTYDDIDTSIPVQGSYSTKIEAVTRRILRINSTDSNAKVLVFSSWKDVLDVLQHALAANGITYVRMKGGRKSQEAISQFTGKKCDSKDRHKKSGDTTESKSVQVLLLLIQHGANGLNLLEAQHVILVEPLLNPAAEAQAIGRVHRIGQQHKTLVHRFIVKDTVEESIYKMNKSRNTSSFISGNRKNQDQPCLTLKDVESLFRVAPTPIAIEDETSNNGSLRDLPPSVAAAMAAERRLAERTNNTQNTSTS